jgi:molecular chaperone DnaJ
LAGQRDYYEVLGVPRDADAKTIKSAFRKLALKYHPDRSKAPDAEERFKEIAEAYGILSDPKKRAEYDARGHAGVAGFTPEDVFGGIDFEDLFGGLGLGGGIFERMFAMRAGPRRGRDVEAALAVPLELVATGGEQTVEIGHPVACHACKGSGAKAGTEPRACAACAGTGRHVRAERKGGISFQQIKTCPDCGGRGKTIDQPCPDCGGHGQTLAGETIKVKVPRGVRDGMILRVAGHGLPGGAAGGPPGDLLVVVRSAPHPRFDRRGAHLWRAETVDLVDAVLGTELTVPTLDGHARVKVPPGTQPDTVLRLHGEGLPVYSGAGRGDLNVRVQVRVPRKLGAKERAHYEKLRALRGQRGAKEANTKGP